MPALLTVTYTPNYIGNHRICFRTTQPSYCCYTDDSASVAGVSKTIIIDLDDFENCLQDLPSEIGCSDTPLDGYVQPFCVDQGSDLNRVVFTATFASAPCDAYNIECQESGIDEITINNPGYGWPVGVVPTVTVIDSLGQGTGFTGELVMSCLPGDNFCSIGEVTITNTGQDYNNLNNLTVEVSPLPDCISNELLIDGNFVNGFIDWNVIPPVDGWLLTPGMVPYYNIPVYSSTGGTLEQNVLTPGRTYLINFEKVTVGARSGTVRFIVSAGFFSITGTASNQYMITKNSGDPDYDAPLSITLTCFGSNVFSIYADSSTADPDNIARLTAVSVVELCEVIDPDLQVTEVGNCGTFTVPDCDGTANPTTYQLWGGSQYAINVCAGSPGPEGFKYTITSNPTTPGEGPELVVNNEFETSLDGWTQDSSPAVSWSSNYGGSAQFGAVDATAGISQDILTVGQEYTVNIDLTIIFDGECTPEFEAFTRFTIYAGTTTYGPLNFSGSESFSFNITCTDNPTFRIEAWDPEACTSGDLVSPQMYCSYVSVKGIGAPVPVSCCDCRKYDVINTGLTDAFDYNYVDCVDQTIKTVTIQAQETQQVCAVVSGIWPADSINNQYFEYVVSGIQDC